MTKKKINISSSGLTRGSSSIPSMSSSCLTRGSRSKDIHSTGFPVKRGMTKDLESGRSMVEMLGVLAIVGVLSVGSIAGYTYAMNKYYANELLAGASERAVLVAAQLVAGKTPNLNEFAGHTAPGGTFGDVEEFEDGGFGIKVSKVKDAVCQNILKAVDGAEVFIAKNDNAEVLNEMSESDCSGDDNSFLFVYADDMGAIDSIFDENTPAESAKNYYCYSGYKVRDNDGNVVANCDCNSDGEFQSDEEAIKALCYLGHYFCYSGALLEWSQISPDRLVKNNCNCSTELEFWTDEEAIAAMCSSGSDSSSSATYYCYSGYQVIDDDTGDVVADCTCPYASTYYGTAEEAIAALCGSGSDSSSSATYHCYSGYQVRDENDNTVTYCTCSVGAYTYGTADEAIAALCSGSSSGSTSTSPSPSATDYHCYSGYQVRDENDNTVTYCTCSVGAYTYGTADEAIAALCQ